MAQRRFILKMLTTSMSMTDQCPSYKLPQSSGELIKKNAMLIFHKTHFYIRVRTRISFSFATIFANLIFFVPFSLTLSQILSQILAIFRQRIILSEKRCSFTDSFNSSNRFKSQYNVKCVGDLKVILALIFKTFAVIN